MAVVDYAQQVEWHRARGLSEAAAHGVTRQWRDRRGRWIDMPAAPRTGAVEPPEAGKRIEAYERAVRSWRVARKAPKLSPITSQFLQQDIDTRRQQVNRLLRARVERKDQRRVHTQQLDAQKPMPPSVKEAANARQGMWAQGGWEAQRDGIWWLTHRSKLAAPMTLYRGMRLEDSLQGDDIAPFDSADHYDGASAEEYGVSTTTDSRVAINFLNRGLGRPGEERYLLEIEAPKGFPGGALPKGREGYEREVILPGATRFRIVGRERYPYVFDRDVEWVNVLKVVPA